MALDEYEEIEGFYSTQEIGRLEEIIAEKQIDIVLMDINLGNLSDEDGLAVAFGLHKIKSAVSIIMLTGYDMPVYRHEAEKIGVRGFLNKNICPDDLAAALICVSRGGICFSPNTKDVVIEELTDMEKTILELISTGKKRKDVADELYISERTLSNHLQHVFEKLEVSSVVEAVTKAFRLGYISPI